VEQVSWDDIQEFLKKLNAKTPPSGAGGLYRLPTEAEWEYACRAGTTTPFSFGDNITPEQVNYAGNRPYNNAYIQLRSAILVFMRLFAMAQQKTPHEAF
jgi:formylglycine-generating enzyme required for sulfatase activity